MINRSHLKKIAVTVVAVFTLGALTGCHHYRDMTPEDKAKYATKRVSKKLDFNEAQSAKFEPIALDLILLAQEIRADRAADAGVVISQLEGSEVDQAKILEIYQKRRDAVDERMPEIVAKVAALHAILNDEQKAELSEWLNDKREDWLD